LHIRWGWQCPRCWDGGPHRDEIVYRPRPYEGARLTAAPLTNTLLEGDGTPIVFRLKDRFDTEVWEFTFADPPWTVTSTTEPGDECWSIDGNWYLWMEHGLIQQATVPPAELTVSIMPEHLFGFTVVNGHLIYEPYP
jgi:hypothetical protein